MAKLEKINILNDSLFKAFMCHVKNRDMVVDVIHALTGIDKDALYNATFIGGEELTKVNKKHKKNVTDFVIRFNDFNRIIIECNQHANEKFVFEKNATYAFKNQVINTSIGLGRYPKTILINIDNFNKYATKRPVSIFMSRNEEGIVEHELYKSIHLILENFDNNTYNVDEEIIKFSKLLKTETTINELENIFNEKYMEVIKNIEEITEDPEFALRYDREERIAYEKEMIKLGAAEEAARQKSIDIAKEMLKKDMSEELISEITKLSIQNIKSLKNELNK